MMLLCLVYVQARHHLHCSSNLRTMTSLACRQAQPEVCEQKCLSTMQGSIP